MGLEIYGMNPEVVRDAIEDLQRFNAKVERLERTRLAERLNDDPPEVVAKFMGPVQFEGEGGEFTVTGSIEAYLKDHTQDEIDAFVLTYRMFSQRNDRVSLDRLRKLYANSWIPTEAAERFEEAHSRVEEYLSSPISIAIGEQKIPRKQLVDIVLYGGLAHTNRTKEEIFQSWTRSGASGFFWVEFVVTLKDMLKYLQYFRDLNEVLITALEWDVPEDQTPDS